MSCNDKNAFASCYMLLFAQLVSFFILFLSDYVTPTLAQAAYFFAFFTSPPLLLIYGFRSLRETAFWLLDAIVLVAEILLAFFYVGAMIYGIRLEAASSILFTRLLAAYAADAVVCTVGYLMYRHITIASGLSVNQHTL